MKKIVVLLIMFLGMSCWAAMVTMPSSVLVFEKELTEKITIVSQDAQRESLNILIARTVFKSEASEVLHVYAQTFFKDSQGQTIEASPAKELILGPLAQQTYAAISSKKNINRFVVYIRMKKENPEQLTHKKPLILEIFKRKY